jgi:hypothetical protein
MTEQLIKGKRINPTRVGFSQPKVLDNGAKLVYVNYSNSKFVVQTPWMSLPWDMSAFTDDKYPKYSITLSFNGMEEDNDLRDFHDRLLDVEQKIIDGGVENSVAWFKKKNQSREVMESIFTPIVRVSTDRETGEPDGKYAPSMRIKVPFRDGNWECKLYDTEGTQLRVNDPEGGIVMDDVLVKGARIRCIIQCVGLWIANTGYMCQWKLSRAEIDIPSRDGNHSFLPDSGDEDEPEPSPVVNTQTTTTMLDDTDDENGANGNDDDDVNDDGVNDDDTHTPSPEPELTPAKKTTKVRVKKSKA